jgi:hypothetical protein
MKKFLVISNSFGVDATRYFHGLCRAAGKDVKVVTLYIGGCSLYRHYRNMLSEQKAYLLYCNGQDTGFFVSMKEALLSDEWDYVTFQQASPLSGDFETYEPFLTELSKYAKKYAPKAKQYIHAIWGYNEENVVAKGKYSSRLEMFEAMHSSYRKAAELIDADYIPSISAMESLYYEIGERTYRDGRHASLGVGRYMLACVWYMVFFGKNSVDAVYRDFDAPVTDEEILAAEKCAREAVESLRMSQNK